MGNINQLYGQIRNPDAFFLRLSFNSENEAWRETTSAYNALTEFRYLNRE
jgi:hypothetical protein